MLFLLLHLSNRIGESQEVLQALPAEMVAEAWAPLGTLQDAPCEGLCGKVMSVMCHIFCKTHVA